MSDESLIIVKFLKESDQETRQAEIRDLVGETIEKLQPLFPGDESEELSTLFELYVRDEDKVANVVKTLQQHRDIEYAHTPSDRKTI